MIRRLKSMLVKEFLQMLRDPRMRAVVLVMPLVQLTVMAFALTTDVAHIRTAVVDPENTPESRALTVAFSAGGYFDVAVVLRSDKRVKGLLDAGRIRAAIRIPENFAADLRAGRLARVQVIADGTLNNDTAVIMNYAGQAAARFNADRPGPSPLFSVHSRVWFNPNLESKYYFVPSLIALMLMLIGLVLTSLAIVREKEIGTIEQVMVTPIRRTEFILGKTLPFLITGFVTMILMFAIAMAVFGIRIHGSLPLLALTAGIYMLGNLGLALLVSVTARTQQQALLTAFFILVPAILLSGFIFPIRNMPHGVQLATVFNPMRWFLQILQGIVVKGVGIESLWKPIAAQTLLAAGFLTLAVVKFRKTLE
ncbi:MAG: ABC transporter permease [Desulfobacterales bacterium]|nr:ABC transporter permease [Desulfobacterales bacterium]